jgi:hypothetical protein
MAKNVFWSTGVLATIVLVYMLRLGAQRQGHGTTFLENVMEREAVNYLRFK